MCYLIVVDAFDFGLKDFDSVSLDRVLSLQCSVDVGQAGNLDLERGVF